MNSILVYVSHADVLSQENVKLQGGYHEAIQQLHTSSHRYSFLTFILLEIFDIFSGNKFLNWRNAFLVMYSKNWFLSRLELFEFLNWSFKDEQKLIKSEGSQGPNI